MTEKRRPLSTLGYVFTRVATFLWGPAELREEVDPLVELDREQGIELAPPQPPKKSERQRSYDNLPRGKAE